MTTTSTTRVLIPGLTFTADGETYTGDLEYFEASKTLAILDDDKLAPLVFTVSRSEFPEAYDDLADGHVLVRNWTEHRGAADQLVAAGAIELTGEEKNVGMFRLNALVARVVGDA